MLHFDSFTHRTASCAFLCHLMSFHDSFKNYPVKTLSLKILKRHHFWRGCPRKASAFHYLWVLCMVPIYRKHPMNISHPLLWFRATVGSPLAQACKTIPRPLRPHHLQPLVVVDTHV